VTWYAWPQSKCPNTSFALRGCGNLRRIMWTLDRFAGEQGVSRHDVLVLVSASYYPHALRSIRRAKTRNQGRAPAFFRGLTLGKVRGTRAHYAAFFRLADVAKGLTPVGPRFALWTGEESRYLKGGR
jgi:hypothetical protein